MAISIKWVNEPTPPGQVPAPGPLSGWKTYLTVIAAVGYLGYCWYNNVKPDESVLALLGFSSVAALRSAAKTSVAQIVNASNPKPPAA